MNKKSTYERVEEIVKQHASDRPCSAADLLHEFQLRNFPMDDEDFDGWLRELRSDDIVTDKNPMFENDRGNLETMWLYVCGD